VEGGLYFHEDKELHVPLHDGGDIKNTFLSYVMQPGEIDREKAREQIQTGS